MDKDRTESRKKIYRQHAVRHFHELHDVLPYNPPAAFSMQLALRPAERSNQSHTVPSASSMLRLLVHVCMRVSRFSLPMLFYSAPKASFSMSRVTFVAVETRTTRTGLCSAAAVDQPTSKRPREAVSCCLPNMRRCLDDLVVIGVHAPTN